MSLRGDDCFRPPSVREGDVWPGLDNLAEEDWLRQALDAERTAVAAELERQHRLLIVEINRRLRDTALTGYRSQRSESRPSSLPKPDPLEEPLGVVPSPNGSGGQHHAKPLHMGHFDAGVGEERSGHQVPGSKLNKMVSSTAFDLVFGALILLNTLVMCMEVQYSGVDLDSLLEYSGEDLPTSDDVFPGLDDFFVFIGWFFGVAFTLELVLKLVGLGRQFFTSTWNIFDFVIVCFWLFDKLTSGSELFAVNPMLLRFCRLARLLRLVKALKWIEMFDALQVLLASIKGSCSILLWSTLLLFSIMTVYAMVFTHFLTEYMQNRENPMDVRKDIYKYFGSFSRGMITMLELTLGNWVPVCRLLMDNVSEAYAALVVFYKIAIGFGVVKVITGCFLHETFKVASTDDEIMIMQKQRENESHRFKMERLFASADDGGDGTLSRDEFVEILSHETVRTWLSAMDISTEDVDTLFTLLSERTGHDVEGGRLSVNDFLMGTTRLRGSAKSLDMWRLLTETEKIGVQVDRLVKSMSQTSEHHSEEYVHLTGTQQPRSPLAIRLEHTESSL